MKRRRFKAVLRVLAILLTVSGLIDMFIVKIQIPSWTLGLVCFGAGVAILLLNELVDKHER